MRNLGYMHLMINETNYHGIPHSIGSKPKKYVIDWILKHAEYRKYKECVFYVWYVRRESATRCIDVFLK